MNKLTPEKDLAVVTWNAADLESENEDTIEKSVAPKTHDAPMEISLPDLFEFVVYTDKK